jgi:hypothetical protein
MIQLYHIDWLTLQIARQKPIPWLVTMDGLDWKKLISKTNKTKR